MNKKNNHGVHATEIWIFSINRKETISKNYILYITNIVSIPHGNI